MFRKKPDYGDLCSVLEVISHTVDVQNDTNEEVIDQIHALKHDVMDLKERINYTLQKVVELTDRVAALEAKKTVKKTTTKKTKGK